MVPEGCLKSSHYVSIPSSRKKGEPNVSQSIYFQSSFQKMHITDRLTFQRSEFSHLVLPSCRGGWDTSSFFQQATCPTEIMGQEHRERRGSTHVGKPSAVSAMRHGDQGRLACHGISTCVWNLTVTLLLTPHVTLSGRFTSSSLIPSCLKDKTRS